MSRTTKASAAMRIAEEPNPVVLDDHRAEAEGPLTEVTALETTTAPLFFEELPAVENTPEIAFATVAQPEVAEDGLGRLQDLLDRAGDPVQATPRPAVARISGGAIRWWRNDPHVLGRVAAVLVVLALGVTCVVVALHGLG